MNPTPPLVKRGRYWVLLNREGHVLRAQRYKTKREAERSYAHYLSLGGDPVYVGTPLPPERVPKGYEVAPSGYILKRMTRAERSRHIVEAGQKTRFKKNEEM